jgi:LysR family transcriptional regulator, glycine cleavage system transcriptional activator
VNRHLPPLNALRAFEAAARHESFSAAADELHVTHGAISHQVKALEAWLGTPLFERRTRAVRLTEAASAYLPAIEGAFNQINSATAGLTRAAGSTPLHVTTTSAFAVRWLAPRLGRLWRDHPNMDLRLHEMPWMADMEPGRAEADLVVRIGPVSRPGLVSLPLMPGTVTPMCSPGLLADGPPLQHPEDLLAYGLLHSYAYAPWQDWFRRAGVLDADVAHGPIFDDTNLAYSAALAGQGVGLLHTALTVDETAAGQLVRPFDAEPVDDMGYYVVFASASANDARVTAFRDWLIAAAGR